LNACFDYTATVGQSKSFTDKSCRYLVDFLANFSQYPVASTQAIRRDLARYSVFQHKQLNRLTNDLLLFCTGGRSCKAWQDCLMTCFGQEEHDQFGVILGSIDLKKLEVLGQRKEIMPDRLAFDMRGLIELLFQRALL